MAMGIVLIWGMNFVVMKFGLKDFTPFQMGAARFALAAFPLLFFVSKPAVGWRYLALYGLLQGVGQFGFLFVALRVGMSASLASVVMQTQVFFTALVGYMVLRERISKAQALGMALAAVGLLFFAMHFLAENAHGYWTIGQNNAQNAGLTLRAVTAVGFLLTLGAAASWATANVVVRKVQQLSPQYDALGFVVWTAAVPILPFLAMTWWVDGPAAQSRWLSAGWQAWAAVAYLAWIATVLAYAMWTSLLKRFSANRVAPFGLGVPVVGLTAGMLILGDAVSPWQWAGVACVALALAATVFGPRWLK